MVPVELLSALKDMVTERQRAQGRQPVGEFARDVRRFSSFHPVQAKFLFERREHVLQLLEVPRCRQELLTHAESGLRASIWRHNQFLSARDVEPRRLKEHYAKLLRDLEWALRKADSWDDLRSRLRPVLAAHHSRLRRTSFRLLEHRFRAELSEPPCSEYSVRLQCQVLRLLDRPVLEPVLDIGCGERACLVNWLRENGIEAYGVDRLVPAGNATWQEDWLAPDGQWRQRRWGTVVSHLAFSNHFVHQHQRCDGEAEEYARHFIAILRQLKPGGSFVYAPAVPFIEDLLPAHYLVTRWAVGSTGLQAARITLGCEEEPKLLRVE